MRDTDMNPTKEDLIQCDQQRHAALLAADTDTLDELFTDDVIYLHSTGVIDSKQFYLDGLKQGKTKYVQIDYQPSEYRVFNGFALILGKVVMQLLIGGAAKEVRALIISTWRFENNRWRMMSWQATK
jgi:hypothetical protein